MRLRDRCFPINFVKFLKTPLFIEHLQWLLLNVRFFKSFSCLSMFIVFILIFFSSIINDDNRFFFFLSFSFISTCGYNILRIISDVQWNLTSLRAKLDMQSAAKLYSSDKLAHVFYDKIWIKRIGKEK